MKKSAILFVLSGLLFFSSCSEHIMIRMQDDPENTGSVVLLPTKPTMETFVTINDKLIVKNKVVNKVTIENVPEGFHLIHYASYDGTYAEKQSTQLKVLVEKDKEIVKLVEVPPINSGYWFYMAGLIFLPVLLLILAP